MVHCTPMPDSILDNPGPQFSTAEYAGTPGVDCCQFTAMKPNETTHRKCRAQLAGVAQTISRLTWIGN